MIAIGFVLVALCVIWAIVRKDETEGEQITVGGALLAGLVLIIAGIGKWLWIYA